LDQLTNPNGLLAEAFRQVRTTLVPKMDRRGYKTVMFVSAQSGSGASAVLGNFAVSLAAVGRRVLVLDANLRQPSQHTIFNTPPSPGLTDVLRSQSDAQTAIVHHHGVDVLPSGDASAVPPELLEGVSFRNLLGKLEREYEFVLIDTPPALLTSDCLMLAKHVDSLVVVIRAKGEQRGMIVRMLRQFEGLRADILGAVLNRAQTAAGGYFRRSYQDFYSYGQGRQSNGKAPAAERVAVRN
jgi:capsular exopolysaccharide synthesis family protein